MKIVRVIHNVHAGKSLHIILFGSFICNILLHSLFQCDSVKSILENVKNEALKSIPE